MGNLTPQKELLKVKVKRSRLNNDKFNLRMDPYERADVVSDQYDDWRIKNAYLMGWMNLKSAAFLETFRDYPPSQPPASFTIDQVQKQVDDEIRALRTKGALSD